MPAGQSTAKVISEQNKSAHKKEKKVSITVHYVRSKVYFAIMTHIFAIYFILFLMRRK